METTGTADIARAQFEMGAACLVQFTRIAEAFERVLPLLERLADPPNADPIIRAMAYLHENWETMSQRDYASAVGYSKSAIFPDRRTLARRMSASDYKPAETDSLRGLYESFTATRERRRGFNDGDGNVDGVEY